MFFEMRFELGTLDSGERSLPFGLLVRINTVICFYSYMLEEALKIYEYLFEAILLKASYPFSA